MSVVLIWMLSSLNTIDPMPGMSHQLKTMLKIISLYILTFRRCESRLRDIYRVIHKSLRDFRRLRYSVRDGHAEGEHVNRRRDTPNFCPTLQVLDMSTLGDAADVNPVIKFLPHTLHVCGRNLLTGTLALPSRPLYRRGQKSRRGLWITLYIAATEIWAGSS